MPYWLIKQEPSEYSYEDLVCDGSTVWEGVKNPQAQQHMRAMKSGDQAFFYHTGDEKAIVAICRISSDPKPLPDNEKHVTVTVEPKQLLAVPVTLAEIKADKTFADWELVRQSRLSVMPCSAERWKAILSMSKKSSGK